MCRSVWSRAAVTAGQASQLRGPRWRLLSVRLRQLIGQLSGDIDSIKDGEEIDGDISAQDFAQFILEYPDIPVELRDLINQAIETSLTDKGGWEKIQGAFETAGIVVGGLTLLALPGGNVIVLGGLAATAY